MGGISGVPQFLRMDREEISNDRFIGLLEGGCLGAKTLRWRHNTYIILVGCI